MGREELENRVRVLEAAVAALQRQAAEKPAQNWLQRMDGAFADDPAFDEVIRYGREFRRGVAGHG